MAQNVLITPASTKVAFTDAGDVTTVLRTSSGRFEFKDSGESNFVDIYANDIVLDGNLTVGGTTTTVNTSSVLIEDPILQLAKGQTSGTPTVDIGFLGLRGSSNNAAFIWDESDDVFAAILTTGDGSATTLTPASYAGFKAGAGTFSGKLTAFLNTTSACLHTRGSNIFFDASSSGTNVNIVARAYDETYWGQMEFTASQGILYTRTTGPLKLGANNAAAITILDGGAVGIGTSPVYAFEAVTGASGSVFEYATHATGTQTIKFMPSATKAGGTSKIYASYAGTGASEGKLALGTYSSQTALVIQSDGNVGIGTASPAYKLQIQLNESAASDFQTNLDLKRYWGAGSSTDRYTGLIISDSNSVQAGIYANRYASHADYESDLSFYTNAGSSNMTPSTALTKRLTIAADGNVGIGTDAPATTLTVAQTADSSGIRLYGYDDKSASYMNFRIDSSGHTNLETSGGSYTKFDIGSGYFLLTTAANEPIYMDFGGSFYWRDRDASNAVRMTLESATGNLGIGTTAPQGPLHVVGGNVNIDTTSGARWLTLDAPTLGGYITFETDGTAFADIGTAKGITANAAYSATDLMINTRSGAKNIVFGINGVEKVRINNNGKVGIGTASPTKTLDVRSEARVWNGTNGIELSYSTGNTSGIVASANTSGNLELRPNVGASAAMFILNNRNVGIGTITPSYKLHVASNGGYLAYFQNTSATDYRPVGFTDENNAVVGSIGYNTSNNVFSVGDTTGPVVNLVGGKVGIGTNAPATTLHVWSGGPDFGVGLAIQHDTSYAGRYATLSFGAGSYRKAAIAIASSGDTYGTGDLIFCVDPSNDAADVASSNERMRIKSDGNVGIGTTAPAILFDVNSSRTHNFIGRFVNTSTVGWGAYIEGGGDSADYSLLIRNQASSDLFAIMGDGEIRVANQTLVDNANTNYKMTFPDNSGIAMGSAYTFANIYGNAGNIYLRANAYPANTGSTSKIYLQTANSSGGQAADVVVNNGQVGIGTTSPSSALNLYEVAGIDNKLRFHNSTTGTGTSNGSRIGLNGDELFINNLEASTIKIYTQSTQTNGITIVSDGKVGIGTTSPLGLLAISGTVSPTVGDNAATNSLLFTGDTEWKGIVWTNAANARAALRYNQAGDYLTFSGLNSGGHDNDQLVIKSQTGNVGINVTDPDAKLEIKGVGGGTGLTFKTTDVSDNENFYIMDGGRTGVRFFPLTVGIPSGTSNATHAALQVEESGIFTVLSAAGGGKVGIGTTAPSSKFHVVISDAQDSGAKAARFTNATGDCGVLIKGTNDNTSGAYGYGRSGGSLVLENKSDTAGNYNTIAFVNSDGFGYAGIQSPCYTQGGTGVTEGGLEFWVRNAGSNYHRAVTINEDGVLDVKSSKFKIGGSAGSNGQILTTDGSGGISWSAAGSGTISGSGTDNYVARFNGTSAIENSIIYDDGTNDVGIGVVPTAVNTSHKSLQIGGNANIQSYGTKGAGGEVDFCHNVYLNQDGNYKLISTDEGTMYRQGGGKHIFYSWASASAGSAVSVSGPKLIIDSAGKVGIGTSAPSAPLEVVGADSGITISSASASRPHLRLVNGTTNMLQLSANGTYAAIGDGTDANRYMSFKGGSVGIGTTAPDMPLVVKTTAAIQTMKLNGHHTGYGSSLQFDATDAGGLNFELVSGGSGTGGSMNSKFSIRDVANNAPRLTIDSAGKVGLGIATPSERLHIAESTSGSASIRITNSTTGTGSSSGLRVGLEADENTTIMNHSNTNLNLGVNGLNVISIKDAKVGIGTTAPANTLHVNGQTRLGSWAKIMHTGDSTQAGYIGSGADLAFGDSNDLCLRGTDSIKFTTNDGQSDAMTIDVNGKVGIGTTAPDNLLTLRSSVQFQQDLKFTVGNTTVPGGFMGAGGASENIWMSAGAELTGSDNSASGFTARNNDGGGAGKAAGIRLGDSAGTITFFTASSLTNGNTFTWDGGSETGAVMSILNDGKVGIGTTSPEAALTLAGPNYTHAVFRTNQSTASQRAGGGFSSLGHATATSRFARLFLDADGADFSGTDYFTIEKFGNSGEVKFLQYSNATMSFWVNTTTQAMTIKNDGNVGIGTTAPSGKLHVVGQSIFDGSAGSPSSVKIKTGTGAGALEFIGRSSDNNSGITWYANNGSSGGAYFQSNGTWMRARADGGVHFRHGNTPVVTDTDGFTIQGMNVGIGTAAPDTPLHIDSTSWPQFKVEYNSTTYFTLDHAATLNVYNNDWLVRLNSSTKLTIKQDGNVGIGTTSPDHKLHVAGTGQVAKIGDNHWRGTNSVTVGTTYVTGVTVNLTNNRGGYLKVIISGDWSGHSAIGYMSEYFIQKGSTTRYSQPGTVIREVTNQHNSDYITSQILDPTLNDGNADFAIQFKTNTGSVSCTVMYEFTGIANSVT